MVMNLKAKMNKKAVERDAELEAGVIDPRTKELGISQEGREVDAVFGALNEDGPNYRDVSVELASAISTTPRAGYAASSVVTGVETIWSKTATDARSDGSVPSS